MLRRLERAATLAFARAAPTATLKISPAPPSPFQSAAAARRFADLVASALDPPLLRLRVTPPPARARLIGGFGAASSGESADLVPRSCVAAPPSSMANMSSSSCDATWRTVGASEVCSAGDARHIS